MTHQKKILEYHLKALLSSSNTNANNLLIGCLSLLKDVCNVYEESENVTVHVENIKNTIEEILVDTTEVKINVSSFNILEEAPKIVVNDFSEKNSQINEKSAIEVENEKEEEILRIAKEIKDSEIKNLAPIENEVTETESEKETVSGLQNDIILKNLPPIKSEVALTPSEDDTIVEGIFTTSSHPDNSYDYLVERWNAKVNKWFQISLSEAESKEDKVKAFVYKSAALRSNLATASTNNTTFKETLKRFDRYWKMFRQQASDDNFEVFPSQFGRINQAEGKIIYSFRPKIKNQENIVICAGIKQNEREIVAPVTLTTLSGTEKLPPDYIDKSLPIYWCAFLGELEVLLKHLDIQENIFCTFESINRNTIQPYETCKELVSNEIKRRADALRSAIKNEETVYRIATNYWRVEECFWSIFHDDGRPHGYSFFDRLRKRLQVWRTIIRKEHNIFVKDFSPANDTLNSINKYVGNVIFHSDKELAAGTVIREIRPAVIVKVGKVTRLLKGRIIAV